MRELKEASLEDTEQERVGRRLGLWEVPCGQVPEAQAC